MTYNSIWSSLVNIECYVRIKILGGMYETALHDEMNLHCRVTSYIENSNYFENIIFSFFYYEAEGITLRTTWKSRMSLRKKLWLIADRVSYQKSWQVKVNTLVRLKSDQVEQMTHTLYFITPRRYADVSRWNINCFLFVNCPFTWFTKAVQLNCERIGSWVF